LLKFRETAASAEAGTRIFGQQLQTEVNATSAPRQVTFLPGPDARSKPLCYQGIHRFSRVARGGVIRRMDFKMKHSRDLLSTERQIFEIGISNPTLRRRCLECGALLSEPLSGLFVLRP
jgi:hypothetical protein